jgi:hypothetical protein
MKRKPALILTDVKGQIIGIVGTINSFGIDILHHTDPLARQLLAKNICDAITSFEDNKVKIIKGNVNVGKLFSMTIQINKKEETRKYLLTDTKIYGKV